jgi:hypothetical protein
MEENATTREKRPCLAMTAILIIYEMNYLMAILKLFNFAKNLFMIMLLILDK